MTTFAEKWLDSQFEIYCIGLWEIAEVLPRDQYGMTLDDPDCTLDDAEDYSDFLPPDARTEATAMRFATVWNTTIDDVLDMPLALYNRRAMIHKAVTLRKPQYTKDDWYMERSSSKYKKRKLKHRRR